MTLEMLVSSALMGYTMEEQTKILKAIETGSDLSTTRLNEGLNKVIEIFDSWEPVVEGYAGFPIERESIQKKKQQFKDDRNIGRVVQAGGSSYVVAGRKSDGRYIVIGKGGEKTAKDPADMGLQVKEHIDIEDLHQAMLEKKMDGVDDNGFTKCWKGYKKRGTKMKGGKEVNNCVKEATAMAKRGYDEAPIRSKIAKSTGGGKAADRATALENRPTYGDANKAKQRQNLARAQRRNFRNTTSSSPGLHGYGHKATNDDDRAKQRARGAQRGVLTPDEKSKLGEELHPSVKRIDAMNKERVAQRAAAAASDAAAKQRSAAAFQAHKKAHIAAGGTPVSALDTWQQKKNSEGKK